MYYNSIFLCTFLCFAQGKVHFTLCKSRMGGWCIYEGCQRKNYCTHPQHLPASTNLWAGIQVLLVLLFSHNMRQQGKTVEGSKPKADFGWDMVQRWDLCLEKSQHLHRTQPSSQPTSGWRLPPCQTQETEKRGMSAAKGTSLVTSNLVTWCTCLCRGLAAPVVGRWTHCIMTRSALCLHKPFPFLSLPALPFCCPHNFVHPYHSTATSFLFLPCPSLPSIALLSFHLLVALLCNSLETNCLKRTKWHSSITLFIFTSCPLSTYISFEDSSRQILYVILCPNGLLNQSLGTAAPNITNKWQYLQRTANS